MGRRRSNLIAIMASFVMIFFGLCASITIAVIGTPDPKSGLLMAVGMFVLIALVPIQSLCAPDRSVVPFKVRRRTWSEFFSQLTQRRQPKKERTVWKRKRIDHTPEPFGHEYVSTFLADRKEPRR